jgi:CRISPR-associated protein Cas2
VTVIVVENATPGLRGHLTRWMLEVRAGVYVGTLSGRVRDRLWSMTCTRMRSGSCLLVHSARNEQGFALRTHGDNSRTVFDMDGLALMRRR